MHTVPEHVWATADGDGFVAAGHVDAAFLAYAAGDQVDDETAEKIGLLKKAHQPANKARTKSEDK